jgi:hypothetical protein
MREAREERLKNAEPPKPQTDSDDIQVFKPGAASDRSRNNPPV